MILHASNCKCVLFDTDECDCGLIDECVVILEDAGYIVIGPNERVADYV